MKKLFVVFVYCLLPTVYCLSQTWQWAQRGGGSDYDQGIGIANDKFDNCYITGNYLSGAVFFGPYILPQNGWNDIFIAKYDSNGNIQWAKHAGGNNSFGTGEAGTAIAVDTSGNLYITGLIAGNAIFDTISLNAYSSGSIFIAKYDANGNCKWAKKAGGMAGYGNMGYGITINEKGDLYITGFFSGTVAFGTHTITSTATYNDVFIAKYDTSGNCLWVKQGNSNVGATGRGIIADKNGNCYVTGFFSSTVTLGGFPLSSSNSNVANTFIARYDSSGNCIWAKQITGAPNGGGFSGGDISIDSLGNSYVIGGFQDSSIFFDSINLSNFGDYDFFIAKYSPNGKCIWAKQGGGIGRDNAYRISTTPTGNNYIIGASIFPLDFDGCSVTGTGAFIIKTDSSGNCLWNVTTNAIGANNSYGVRTDAKENYIYIGGAFQDTANFGPATLTSTGLNDVFIAKLNTLGASVPPTNGNRVGFTIYPNPSDGTYTMEISQDLLKSKMFIYDVLWKEIFQTTLSKNTTVIDVPALVQGFYVVKLQTPDGKILQQSIVQQ